MRILLLVIFLLTRSVAQALPTDPSAVSVTTQGKNLFILKAPRKFIGATVEIRYFNGEIVNREKLMHRRIIIDFADVKTGAYVIRIDNDKESEEFQFIRK